MFLFKYIGSNWTSSLKNPFVHFTALVNSGLGVLVWCELKSQSRTPSDGIHLRCQPQNTALLPQTQTFEGSILTGQSCGQGPADGMCRAEL